MAKQVAVGGFPFSGWLDENATNQVALTGGAWVVETTSVSASVNLTGVSSTSGVGSPTIRADASITLTGVSSTAAAGTPVANVEPLIAAQTVLLTTTSPTAQTWFPPCPAGTTLRIEAWGPGSGGGSASGGGGGGSYALNYYTITAADVSSGITYTLSDGSAGATSGDSSAAPDTSFGVIPKNLIPNTTNIGAATPSTFPSGWVTVAGGLTVTLVGFGVDPTTGYDYCDIRWNGTSTGGGFGFIPSANGFVSCPALPSTNYTVSAYVAIVGGSATNVTDLFIQPNFYDANVGFLAADNAADVTVSSLTSTPTRYGGTVTSAVGTAVAQPYFVFTPGAGAVDITIRFAGLQFEQGSSITTYQATPAGYALAKGGAASTSTGAPAVYNGLSFGLSVASGGAGASQASGGGGGGAAGPDGAGNSATSATGGTGDAGLGGAAGVSDPRGGGGGTGVSTGTGGAAGAPGGGGGSTTTSGTGGAGSRGQIQLTFAPTTPAGVETDAAIGTLGLQVDNNPTLAGVSSTAAVGTLLVSFDVFVNLTGVSSTPDVGTLIGDPGAMLTGVQSDTALGTLATARTPSLTGVQSTAGIGQPLLTVTPNFTNIALTGVESDAAVGSLTDEVGAGIAGVDGTGQIGNFVAFVSAGGLSLTDLSCEVFAVATEDDQVTLRWSDTDGYSWSDSVRRSIGATGQYLTNPQWRRLGMSRRGRVFEISWSCDQPTALQGATVMLEDAST